MLYAITHVTHFAYDAPVSESHMEVRMQPLTRGAQSCLRYELEVEPRVRAQRFRDHLSNWVDYFSVPGRHQSLLITARTDVDVGRPATLPRSLDAAEWDAIDSWVANDAHWDLRNPTAFATWSPALIAYADSVAPARSRVIDPLSAVREIVTRVHRDFEYSPYSTRVNSTIDEALAARRGVCQDLAHVTVSLLRRLNLPTRYVSGYIAPPENGGMTPSAASATHAWIEVLLPRLGWVGFDPTHNMEASERHVRVAVGRDYADVPPARGVCKGGAGSTLTVTVDIRPAGASNTPKPLTDSASPWISQMPGSIAADSRASAQQSQQQ
jgi:transglutaminase-like putative cysteine protease